LRGGELDEHSGRRQIVSVTVGMLAHLNRPRGEKELPPLAAMVLLNHVAAQTDSLAIGLLQAGVDVESAWANGEFEEFFE
jgi:hypothetical protein